MELTAGLLANAVGLIPPTLKHLGRDRDPWVVLRLNGKKAPAPTRNLATFAGTFRNKQAPVVISPYGDLDEASELVEGVHIEWNSGQMNLIPGGCCEFPVELSAEELVEIARSTKRAERLEQAKAIAKRILETDERLATRAAEEGEEKRRKAAEACHKHAAHLVEGCRNSDVHTVISVEKKLRLAMKKLAKEHGIVYRAGEAKLDEARQRLTDVKAELATFTPEIVADLIAQQRHVDELWLMTRDRERFIERFPGLTDVVDDLDLHWQSRSVEDWLDRIEAAEDKLRVALGGARILHRAGEVTDAELIHDLVWTASAYRCEDKLSAFQKRLRRYGELAGSERGAGYWGHSPGLVESLEDALTLEEQIVRALDNLDLATKNPTEFIQAVVDPINREDDTEALREALRATIKRHQGGQ